MHYETDDDHLCKWYRYTIIERNTSRFNNISLLSIITIHNIVHH